MPEPPKDRQVVEVAWPAKLTEDEDGVPSGVEPEQTLVGKVFLSVPDPDAA